MRPYDKETQKAWRGVAVFAEYHQSSLNDITLEILLEGKRIAEKLCTEVIVFAIGYQISKTIDIFKEYGADKIYLVDSEQLNKQNELLYSNVFIQIIKQCQPEIVLIGSTYFGRAVAPKIASCLNTGLTADCTEFDVDVQNRLLIQKRPAYSGQLMAEIVCPDARPQMATFRLNVIKHQKPLETKDSKVIKPEIVWNQDSTIEVSLKSERMDILTSLLDAKTVIGIGRGIKKKENLEKVYELASLLNAKIGATRAIVEAGWLDLSCQIGQTGKIITPDIYIACGISGAMQHMVGIQNARTIFAINHDKNAPIFSMTDYGMIGDVEVILPLLISEIRLLKQ